ncbi:hypothetical protein [Dyadobacter sp. CY326]|uniref:hypothetical protein n=1 Tax=Dyadobacter sp. CY326 TaxID=2907300 RepID=UPI001F35D5B2|nr:hypothetical protein [Dyadobacter sp. CY326]MCE7067169.1 hypothetical protein [Dyadobacter sp. CY326]
MKALRTSAIILSCVCCLALFAISVLWWKTCHLKTISIEDKGKGHITAFSTLSDLVEHRKFWYPHRRYYEVAAIKDGPYMFVGYHEKENILVFGHETTSGYTAYGIVTHKELRDITSRLSERTRWEDINMIISKYPQPKRVPVSNEIF